MATWCIERHGHDCPLGGGPGQRLAAWFRRFRWPATEDNTLFWHIAHSVDEDLLLLLPIEEVAARAREIKSLFERNIKHGATRRIWLGAGGGKGPIDIAVRDLTEAPQSALKAESPKVRLARQVLRRALHEVNEQTDLHFRQLAANMLMRAWSGLLLFVLLVSSTLILSGLLLRRADNGIALLSVLLLLGAAGAMLANLMSKDAFKISLGPARRYFFYYLFAKPVQGAFAAFTLYLVLESGFLFTLVGAKNPNFMLATLSLSSGFAAEKFFGTTISKALNQLFKTAEKTETTPTSPEETSEEE